MTKEVDDWSAAPDSVSYRFSEAKEALDGSLIDEKQVLNEKAGAEAAPAAVMPDGAVPSRSGHLPSAEVLAVPLGREGLAASALPEAYQDLLELVHAGCRPPAAGGEVAFRLLLQVVATFSSLALPGVERSNGGTSAYQL